jgi:toxin ParE1/3/4
MARFRVSRKAIQDLDDIWYFIATDSESAASEQMDRLYSAFRALASQPRMGRERPEIGPGMRSFVTAEQVIFYQIRDSGVLIVRVWDGRRNLTRINREL